MLGFHKKYGPSLHTQHFFKIIKTLEKENIFIISHKGDILFDKFTNIIKYEKVQNFTQLGTI